MTRTPGDPLTAIQDSVNEYLRAQDTSGLLDPDRVHWAETCSLLAKAESGAESEAESGADRVDLDRLNTVAWWHLCRAEVLGPAERPADNDYAVALFAVVFAVQPDAVPEPLRQFLVEHAGPLPPDLAEEWHQQGLQLFASFDPGEGRDDLDVAVRRLRLALRITAAGSPDRAGRLTNLCALLRSRASYTGDLSDADESVRVGRDAVAAAGPVDPARPAILANLGAALDNRHRLAGRRADLDEAIRYEEQALDAAPAGHPYRRLCLGPLALGLSMRYQVGGDLADLTRSVELLREEAAEISPADPQRVTVLGNLAAGLAESFEASGSRGDLDEAIEAGRAAVNASAGTPAARFGALFNLARALRERYLLDRLPADLDESLQRFRGAVAVVPAGHPEHARLLAGLADTLRIRFDVYGSAADIEDGIRNARAAVEAAGTTGRYRGDAQNALAAALGVRAKANADPAGLDEAIAAASAMRDATGPDGLAPVLADLLRQRSGPGDLDTAVDLLRAAVRTAAEDTGYRTTALMNLGVALHDRAVHNDTADDLDEAVAVTRTALAATAQPPEPYFVALNLAVFLFERYQRTGAPADVVEAADLAARTVVAMPADHARSAGAMSVLLHILRTRFADADPAERRREIERRRAERAAAAPADERTRATLDLALALALIAEAGDGPVDGRAEAVELLRSAQFLAADLIRAEIATHTEAADEPRLSSRPTVPPGDTGPDEATAWAEQGLALLRRGQGDDADTAIDLFRRAVDATPATGPRRAQALSDLAHARYERFRIVRQPADLDAYVAGCRDAVALVPAGGADRCLYATNLARALRTRFEERGTVSDLDEAVIALETVAAPADPGDPQLAGCLVNLYLCRQARFATRADPADRDAAIDALHRAAEVSTGGYRCTLLSQLSSELRGRHAATGDPDDLRTALRIARLAVEAAEHLPDPAPALTEFGIVLHTLHTATGDEAHLDELVQVTRRAADGTGPGDPARSGRLTNLRIALRARYSAGGDPDDLNRAIGTAQQALAVTPAGDPALAERLRHLHNDLFARFELANRDDDLDRAIDAAFAGRAVTEPEHPEHVLMCSKVAVNLMIRYRLTGNPADLDQAVDAARDAVRLSGPDHPSRSNFWMQLAAPLSERFRLSGRLADIDEAVSAARAALDAASTDSPSRFRMCTALGNAYRLRFDRTGERGDGDLAVESERRALAAVPEDSPGRPAALSNLSAALMARWQRFHDLDDIRAAVRVSREAVTTAGTADAEMWSNLSGALMMLHDATGEADLMDESITAARQALESPHHLRLRPALLTNLSGKLSHRYQAGQDEADGREAVDAAGKAVDATERGASVRANRLIILGTAETAWFRVTGEVAARDRAVQAYREAFHAAAAAPASRLLAAMSWLKLTADASDWDAADAAVQAALQVLPMLTDRALTLHARQLQLTGTAGLASTAAAVALNRGDPVAALTVLEQARGLLIAQSLEIRSDVDELRDLAPELAAEFDRLRDQLDQEWTAPVPAGDREDTRQGRWELTEQWDDLLIRIRRLPGHAGFLKAPDFAQMRATAREGPIVVVTASGYRCDALVLTAEGVQAVPLPAMTEQRAVEYAATMVSLAREQDNDALREVLEGLWDGVVEPVLAHLGLLGAPDDGQPRPRLWWMPVGALAVLPLHAAGRPEGGRPANALDVVVSSYLPTIRALSTARPESVPPEAPQALVVGVSRVAGQRDLPYAAVEAREVARAVGAEPLIDEDATRENVMAAMAGATIAHLACHAAAGQDDPLAGHLALSDGPLELRRVLAVQARHGRLAFLSACTTALVNPHLPDESIHLSSAFYLAGFDHVIGTLWPIIDAVAARIARMTYAEMAGQPAARALHAAVQHARRTHPNLPLVWASHVHLGR
jgi:tetratricopeptide (TPR) repeat protein